jgi:hypothetical protein
MLDRMLLRLFALPLVLLLVALATLWLLGSFVPDQLGNTLFAGLGQQAIGLSLPAFLLLSGAAAVIAAYQGFQLWRWHEGKTDCCHYCGGMVTVRDGRYGLYVHCLACGKNRSLR